MDTLKKIILNLFDVDGIPVALFRTDNTEIIT
jgi:hypothetical protein